MRPRFVTLRNPANRKIQSRRRGMATSNGAIVAVAEEKMEGVPRTQYPSFSVAGSLLRFRVRSGVLQILRCKTIRSWCAFAAALDRRGRVGGWG